MSSVKTRLIFPSEEISELEESAVACKAAADILGRLLVHRFPRFLMSSVTL